MSLDIRLPRCHSYHHRLRFNLLIYFCPLFLFHYTLVSFWFPNSYPFFYLVSLFAFFPSTSAPTSYSMYPSFFFRLLLHLALIIPCTIRRPRLSTNIPRDISGPFSVPFYLSVHLDVSVHVSVSISPLYWILLSQLHPLLVPSRSMYPSTSLSLSPTPYLNFTLPYCAATETQ